MSDPGAFFDAGQQPGGPFVVVVRVAVVPVGVFEGEVEVDPVLQPRQIVAYPDVAVGEEINVQLGVERQPRGGGLEEIEFLLANAAVACELTTGDPLTFAEFNRGVCLDGSNGLEIFPEKRIYASAVVSMFLHGGLLHLLGNMWFLWIFGNNIEEAYGRIGYAAMYLLAGLVATAGFVLTNANETVPLVGASGAISGVMGAYLILYPTVRVHTLIFLGFFVTTVALPAWVMLVYWILLQFIGSALAPGSGGGTAFLAHLGGFVAGMVLIKFFADPKLVAMHHVRRPRRTRAA